MSENTGEVRYQSALRAWAERKIRETYPDAKTVVIETVEAEMDGGYGSPGTDDSYESPGPWALSNLLKELLGPAPAEPTRTP